MVEGAVEMDNSEERKSVVVVTVLLRRWQVDIFCVLDLAIFRDRDRGF
jgi:hypothetical protein